MDGAPLPVGQDDGHRHDPGSPADVLIDPRILVVGGPDQAIHDELRQALEPGDDTRGGGGFAHFHIDSATHGEEAVTRVRNALAEGRPYAVAFVELWTPPRGIGIEIIRQFWHDDPDLQIGLCTALADAAWEELVQDLGPADGLLVLRTPFAPIEIRQMAHALSSKWMLNRELTIRLGDARRAQAGPPPEPIAGGAEPSEGSAVHRRAQAGPPPEPIAQAADLVPDAGGPADGLVKGLRSLALAFKDLGGLLEVYRHIVIGVSTLPGQEHLLTKLEEAEQSANLSGLQREVPRVFERLARRATPAAAVKQVFHQHASAPPPRAAEAGATARRQRNSPSPRRR